MAYDGEEPAAGAALAGSQIGLSNQIAPKWPQEMRSSQARGSALLAEWTATAEVQRRQKRMWHAAETDRKPVWPGLLHKKEGCEMKGGKGWEALLSPYKGYGYSLQWEAIQHIWTMEIQDLSYVFNNP